jgi:hypothetical protein
LYSKGEDSLDVAVDADTLSNPVAAVIVEIWRQQIFALHHKSLKSAMTNRCKQSVLPALACHSGKG